MAKVISIFYSVIIFAIITISNTAYGAIPSAERAALIALYNSTNGDSWTDNSGWKNSPIHSDGFALPGTEGSWHGISLNSYNSIRMIEIDDNQLNGSLPPELGNLSNLTRLDLSSNQLSGSIPPELGSLFNLTSLNLGDNQLSGSIPYGLGIFTSLELLILSQNQLSGNIPPALGNLSNLILLFLSSNQLSGSIPPELGDLTLLTNLGLDFNQLSGSIPPELGDLANLTDLSIVYNQLSGSIPPELGNLTNLKRLNLSNSLLSGSIPPELGNLSNLTRLNLSDNQLSGNIPSELGELTNLTSLILSSNQLSGSIPSELGNLSNLTFLHLYRNQLSGRMPYELGNLTSLKSLSLWSNQLSGNIPENIINLISLSDYSGISICRNFLYTNDDTVRDFINQKHSGDWENCQNEIVEEIYYRDDDGDGYGDPNNSTYSVSQPSGYVIDNTDCNDNDGSIHPGAIETRGDSIDQDCDGSDLPTLFTYYQDEDSDGFGDPNSSLEIETQPTGYVADNTDCNDDDSSINPGATEIRGDGIDQDCDGNDLPSLNTYYEDNDNDGYGDPNNSIEAESQPSGYVIENTDCDDSDSTINPGAKEIRGDGIDQDCNSSDLPSLSTYYEDYDNDGYGDPNNSTESETQPEGWVTDNTDCNDNDSTIHPGGIEIRGDGIDQDCNGSDLPSLITYYEDQDNDGYGGFTVSTEAESQPSGYVTDNTDCDDSDSSINPGATENCNGVDDNCEGTVDEGCFIVPDKVTLILPSSTIEETTPTFTWDEVSNATWYKIYLMSTSSDYKFVQWYEIEDDFSNYPEVSCTDGECSITLDSTLDIGSYEWFVRGWNENGNGEWSDGTAFTVQGDDSPPSKVTHTSPSGNTQDSTPTFTWTEDPASTWYKLWIGYDNGERIFAQWYESADICSGGNCSVTLESELLNDSYEWWVKSWNDYGNVWSDGLLFLLHKSTNNQKPVANSISLSVDSTIPYIEQQLSATDADGDVLVFELVSPTNGDGYSSAYINPNSGMLYVTNEPGDSDSVFALIYRVTDAKLYSDNASVTVQVTYLSEDEKETGREDVDPEEYAGYELSDYNSDLLGGDLTPSRPKSIDLSSNFPAPGDQGQQGSCVGWATAYALKTYQEKVEIGWSLNTSSHLFSPAFIYNQIVIDIDQGSYISDALNLAVQEGISTLSTMPYSDRDYVTQPSISALAEASLYKAVNWYRVNDTSQIKAALVNRTPVVCGISIYQSFYNLSGSNSVYNTADGNNLGGHAVTIVGYDDNMFGGAFKIINSWSPSWGDNGYFWLPYSFASQGIMSEAYVLEDAENGSIPEDEEPTEPKPDYNTLPNLTISSWNASYDPRPRGTGTLTYEVINNGSGNASLGADINLMLSRNNNITSSDSYIVYEEISFDLLPGDSVYRDSYNALSFNFPDQIESGVYYMALWVDDMGEVEESNENDNISLSSSTITIENSMPDLSVNSWYADWDGYGNGTLTYEIENSGVSAINSTNWYINLVLDLDQTIGNGNEIYLFYEPAAFYLNPGATIYRNNLNSAYFNLYVDHDGYNVPFGVYYMALWVDDLYSVDESNELNNGSYSWGVVNVSNYSGAALKSSTGDKQMISGTEALSKAYNGKRLPPKDFVMKKVMITKQMSGEIKMQMLDDDPVKKKENSRSEFQTKQISSSTGLIFPSSERIQMPNGVPSHEK